MPAYNLFPAVRDPRVPTGAWFAREAEMCPPRLFLPSPVPTELRFGSKSPPAEWSLLPAPGVDEPAPHGLLGSFSRQHLILTLIAGCD